jgi:sugar O-acyltransferase (sialic acid O-acetyltransferase NeuD family)
LKKKRRLFIIGAGNFGRVLENWLSLIEPPSRDWKLTGYLHHCRGNSPLDGFPTDLSIVGDWHDFNFRDSDLCVMGTSDPTWKERVYESLKDKVRFYTFIDPAAGFNPRFVDIGEGSVICRNSVIACNVQIGRFVTVCMGSQIGHDVVIGNFTSLMASVDISGHAKVGESVFLGSKAVVTPHKSICSDAKVGAGSIVIRSIKDNKKTYFGNPAKPIDFRELAGNQ